MKSLRAGCYDGMNMISHGQAASNGYSKNFKRGRTRDSDQTKREETFIRSGSTTYDPCTAKCDTNAHARSVCGISK